MFSNTQAIMEGPPFALLERAAHEIARTLLLNHAPRVRLVQVCGYNCNGYNRGDLQPGCLVGWLLTGLGQS